MPREAIERSSERPGGSPLLIGLVALAMVPRILAAIFIGGDTFRFADEAIYLDAAAGLRHSAGLEGPAAAVPGYVWYLSVVDVLVPGGVVARRVAQAALLAMGVLLCEALGRRLGGPKAGLFAAVVFALDPLLTVSASLLYPDAPAAILLAAVVLLVWREDRTGRGVRLLAAGAVLGLFAMFRVVGLTLLPATVFYLGTGSAVPARRRIMEVSLLLTGWLLVVGPWLGLNRQSTGRWLPVPPAVQAVPGIGASVGRQGLAKAVANAAAQDPGGFLQRTLGEFWHFWEPYPTRLATDDASVREALSERDPRLSRAPLSSRRFRDLISAVSSSLEMVLAAVGMWIALRSRRRETLWLVALMLGFALGYAMFFGKMRYRIPIVPLVIAFTGVGAARLLDARLFARSLTR